MNDTIDLINKRISLRKFSDKLVTKEHIDTIVNSALRAPTAGNLMLYSMIIVKDKERLVDMNITRVVKQPDGNAKLVEITETSAVRGGDHAARRGLPARAMRR